MDTETEKAAVWTLRQVELCEGQTSNNNSDYETIQKLVGVR